MARAETRFSAARLLSALQVTPSDFGYRAQALLAETLVRMGGAVDGVFPTGHPDIRARIGGRILLIQSKATTLGSFQLLAADYDGIAPGSADEQGYLAVLDRRAPLSWIFIDHKDAGPLLDRLVPLALLQAMSDQIVSEQVTEAFCDLVVAEAPRLEAFVFELVARRAIRAP